MSERPLNAVLSRLEGVRPSGREGRKRSFVARCPAHEDRNPSLSITEGDDDRVLLNCHAGCPPEAVVSALGLSLADLFEPKVSVETSARRKRSRSIVATYDYLDTEGVLLFQTVRFEPKDFRQRRPDGRSGWTWNLRGIDPVLYRLPDVLEAVAAGRVVFVTEGEKDADRLASLGFVATCNPMGAGKWRSAYTETLRGTRVVILPDNDTPGRDHARAVARSLYGIAAEVRVAELPGLPVKGDVSDWLSDSTRDAGGDPSGRAETLRATVREAPLFDPETEGPEADEDLPPIGVLVADVERESVAWLWPGRIALGKLTILDGDPGLGKSTLYCNLAGRLTRGTSWPDGVPVEESGGVVIVTTEDGIGDTIRPRLEEAGADVQRVSVVQLIPEAEGPGRVPVLPHDVEVLMGECRRVGARLLVIDPLMAHLGAETNSYRDQDVRRALAPLSEAAERYGVAVVVLRHLNKATGGKALYRGGGSIGIIGAARVGLMVGRDPDDEHRVVLACSKNNIAVRPDSLAFRLVSSPDDPGTAVIRWEGTSPLSAEDLCRPAQTTTARDDAGDWLKDFLAGGPRLSKEVFDAGREAGHTKTTLYRAKKELGVEARKQSFDGAWEWRLPDASSPPNSPKMVNRGRDHLGKTSGDGTPDPLPTPGWTGDPGADEDLFDDDPTAPF